MSGNWEIIFHSQDSPDHFFALEANLTQTGTQVFAGKPGALLFQAKSSTLNLSGIVMTRAVNAIAVPLAMLRSMQQFQTWELRARQRRLPYLKKATWELRLSAPPPPVLARPFQMERTQFQRPVDFQQTMEHLPASETLFNLQANPIPEL